MVTDSETPEKKEVELLDADQEQTYDVKEFEDIIDHLGAFGHWQRVIFVLICLPDIHGAFAMLLPVFIGATPQWRCDRLMGSTANETAALNLSANTCPNTTDCEQFGFYDEFTSVVSQWTLICKRDFITELISTIQMCGILLGAFVFGQMSDSIGRKKSYFLAFFIIITAGFVSAFANSWELYAACRFIVGTGFGGTMVVNCVYPLEFIGSRWRMLCGTVGFWGIGQMLLALIAYFVRNWRHLVIASSISGAPYFLLWWIIPESPRWLVQHRRFDEANVILGTIARKNKRPQLNIKILQKYAEIDKEEEDRIKKYTYFDLFRSWRYTKFTLINILAWFTVFLTYYEVTYNLKNLSGNRYLNMFLSGLFDLTAMITVILILNFLGRRKSMSLYLIISAAALLTILIIIVTDSAKDLASAILGLALVGKSAALAGTYVIQIFCAELFPTVIRNVGVGAGSMAARIGGITAPQLVYLGKKSTMAPYIICFVLAVVVLPLLFALPETNGKPLEDVVAPHGRRKSQTSCSETGKPQEYVNKETNATKL